MPLESRLLDALRPWLAARRWLVGFSGGLDSTVLLHALVQLAQRHAVPPISAIHVHHGLQAAADNWPAHCREVCAANGVPLEVVRVQVEPGASLERAAREARYASFAERLDTGDLLLTAQHRDDQAETLLFRLLRGAGVRGLAAMPVERPLGQGRLVRPLLDITRAQLQAYADSEGLRWIEDPSNQSVKHARNYLRLQVLPLINQRWPQAAVNLARTAAHMAEAQALLDELARADLAAARMPSEFDWLTLPSLCLSTLRALSPARQRNALRHWLAPFTPMPDSDHWSGWASLRDARGDATPCWRLGCGEVRRSGERIWWVSNTWTISLQGFLDWPQPGDQLALPGNGQLRLVGPPPSGSLQLRYRRGGEAMTLPGRGRRDLKRLLNEAGVPGFVRSRLPLLFLDGELVAVANLPQFDTQALSLQWAPPTDARFELVGSFK
ncbi:tRNA lysidine(34) synthetase TilS [Pseudomonas sp. NPDC077382]